MSNNLLIEILEQILGGDRDETKIAQLREWLKVTEDRSIQTIQHGKSIANIGQIQESEIHIGDRIYTGSDAESIKRVLFECGLIKDKLPGFERVECTIPQTIYPVLIHSKHQQLVEEIIFHKSIGILVRAILDEKIVPIGKDKGIGLKQYYFDAHEVDRLVEDRFKGDEEILNVLNISTLLGVKQHKSLICPCSKHGTDRVRRCILDRSWFY